MDAPTTAEGVAGVDLASAASPLSQLPHLDDAMLSAMPGESDRKFMNSLSQRKKRRDRRRLHETACSGGGGGVVGGSSSETVGGGGGGGSEAVDGAAGTSSAALLLAAETSPAALEDGDVSAALPPPTEFGGGGEDSAAELQEEAEIVRDQMDALPSMVAHMEGRRTERQNLQYRMRTIAAKVPPGARAKQTARRLWAAITDLADHAFDGLTLGLYRTSFGRIEGNFGAGCASYFSFIRWLFLFNLAVSCIVFACCVFPYLLVEPGLAVFHDTLPPHNVTAQHPALLNASRCSRLVTEKIANLTNNQNVWARVTDLVTGGGWMLKLPVFLGFYFNKTTVEYNATAPADPLTYRGHFNTPVAMLCSVIALIVCGVGAALNTSNSLYRQTQKVSVRGSKSSKISTELFTAWDFGLRAQKAVRQRQRSVAMRLRSLVLHLQLKARSRSPGTLAARVLANVTTVGLYCSAAYLIFYTTELQSKMLSSRRWKHQLATDPTRRLLIDLMPQLTISLINVVVPLVLGKLIVFEYYSASVEILVQLLRVVFLKLLSFVTLIVTVAMVLINCPNKDHCDNCLSVETLCWETYVGQQFYRTLVIDTLLCLIVTPALATVRWLLNVKVGGRVFSKVPLSELLISNEVLGLVYRQSVCFIGAFFCPLLLPIACLSYGCLFHIKRFTLRFMAVSNKSFRASRLERFFLDVLLLFLFVLLVPLAACVLLFSPSRGCGPFRLYEAPFDTFRMADSLSNWVTRIGVLKLLFNYTVLNETAHLLVLIMLLLFTYFFYSVVKARETLIEFLEKKLDSESKIKLELANRELQLMKMNETAIMRPVRHPY